jgi:hypothetical protein
MRALLTCMATIAIAALAISMGDSQLCTIYAGRNDNPLPSERIAERTEFGSAQLRPRSRDTTRCSEKRAISLGD